MRLGLVTGMVILALAGCAPRGPEPSSMGMGDYGRHMRAAETTRPAAPENRSGDAEGRAVAAEALAAVRPQAAGNGSEWMEDDGAGAPIPAGAALIGGSDSLTSDDVLDMDTARATRDAERDAFEARRASFEPVAPTALPERPDDGPNIVAYALRTSHGVGTPRFTRSPLTLQSHARNCEGFASADQAQEEFLRRGGPERDPLNLDPNGDGFACSWSPEPFRAAARAED